MLENPVSDVALGAFHARQLAQMRSLAPQTNIESAITADLGDTTLVSYFPPLANRLAFWFGGNRTRKILYIDGVTTNDQANRLMDGYGNGLGIPVVLGNNIWINQQRDAIINAFTLATLTNAEYVDLVGYSAGGAVALAIREVFRSMGAPPKCKVITFGAPRTGQENIRDGLSNAAICRWMTATDPIPLLPLRLQDAPHIAAIYSLGRIVNWSFFVHARGGVEVYSDGTVAPSVLPQAAAANPVSSVASWAWSQEGDPNNPHGINTYIAYLTAAEAKYNTPASQIAREAPAEVPARTDRAETNLARERVESAIATAGHVQNARPVVIPDAQLFSVFRQGRIWYVALGDRIVFTTANKRTARHIARAGNDFLRSMPKQALVDPDALKDQIEAFLQLAGDPSSGFSPTINTTPPS